MIQRKTYKSFLLIFIDCLVAGLTIMSYSFAVNSMNNALHQMLIIFEIPKDKQGLISGILQSSVYAGNFVGCYLTQGILKYGNRVTFLVVDAVIIFGSLLQISTNIWIFVVGRFIMGLGAGVSPSASGQFVKQYCPKEIYALFGGLNTLLFSGSILLTYVLGLFFQPVTMDVTKPEDINNYWQYYFTIYPIFFCTLRTFLLCVYLRMDTPLVYARKSDVDNTMKVIQRIYKQEYQQEAYDMVIQESLRLNLTPSVYKQPYLRRTMMAHFIMFYATFNGYNAVVQFSTSIFQDVFSEDIAHYMTLGIAILKSTVYVFGITSAQKNGRRPSFIYGNICMIITLFSIGILSFFIENDYYPEQKRQLQITTIFFIFVFLAANFFSATLLASTYIPEITPARGVHDSWLSFWIWQFSLLLLFPIVKESFGISMCFFFFFLVTLVSQYFLYKYLMETKGATEEQILKFFYPNLNTFGHTKVEDQSITTNNEDSFLLNKIQ